MVRELNQIKTNTRYLIILNQKSKEHGIIMAKQINKVNKKECMDAIEYFFSIGCIEDMRSDGRYYCRICRS